MFNMLHLFWRKRNKVVFGGPAMNRQLARGVTPLPCRTPLAPPSEACVESAGSVKAWATLLYDPLWRGRVRHVQGKIEVCLLCHPPASKLNAYTH